MPTDGDFTKPNQAMLAIPMTQYEELLRGQHTLENLRALSKAALLNHYNAEAILNPKKA